MKQQVTFLTLMMKTRTKASQQHWTNVICIAWTYLDELVCVIILRHGGDSKELKSTFANLGQLTVETTCVFSLSLSDLYKVSVPKPCVEPRTLMLLLSTGQSHWKKYSFCHRSAKVAFGSVGEPEPTGRCAVASDRAGSARNLGVRLALQAVLSTLCWPLRESDSEQRNQKSQRSTRAC